MDRRIRLQIAEALGPTNRWFCSEAHGCEVRDAELLLTHYIKNGGAEDFAKRYASGEIALTDHQIELLLRSISDRTGRG
jgi:hypothetical protein